MSKTTLKKMSKKEYFEHWNKEKEARKEKIASGEIKTIEAIDMDYIGLSLFEYLRNPFIPLWQKILYYHIYWQAKNPEKVNFMKYQTIIDFFNMTGQYKFIKIKRKERARTNSKKILITSDKKLADELGPENAIYDENGYVKWGSYRNAVKELRKRELILAEYETGKKRDAVDPKKWIYRKIYLNYEKITQYVRMMDEEEINQEFPEKSWERKFTSNPFYACKTLAEQIWKSMKQAARERWESFQQFYYDYIARGTYKYFRYTTNSYILDKVPLSKINHQEEQGKQIMRDYMSLLKAEEKRSKRVLARLASERLKNTPTLTKEDSDALDQLRATVNGVKKSSKKYDCWNKNELKGQ